MNTATLDRPAIEPTTALTLPQRAAVALKTSEHEIKLRELLTNSARIVAPANKAARDECHTAYMVLKNTRCSIVNLAADATEDAKAFTKAVKVESDRLIAITAAEEERLQGLRDEWDEKVAAEKAAKIAAERARVEAIQKMIASLRDYPRIVLAQDPAVPSAALKAAIDEFDGWAPHIDDYAEFVPVAAETIAASLATMRDMMAKELAREQAAHAAEQARIAEAERVAAEKAENARVRAENERIANEQAAEANRLADLAAAQELAAKQLREKAESNLKAERDAQAELVRIDRERVAAEHAKAAAELKAEREKFAAQVAIHEAAIKLDADHAEALAMNVQFDIDAAADLARCTETANAMLSNGCSQDQTLEELAASLGDGDPVSAEPTDEEIIDAYVENFGGTRPQAVARLLAFVGDEVAA